MLASLAVMLTLAVPSWSQDRAAEIDFENQRLEVEAAAAQSREASPGARAQHQRENDQKVLDATLTAMADANPAGESVVDYIRHNGIAIRFVSLQSPPQAVPSKAIDLDPALPRYPRVLAPAIAREAMQRKLASMPDSAEREYMIRSTVARAWLELGGDRQALPVIEPLTGYSNQILADYMRPWLANKSEMALDRIRQLTGKPELGEIHNQAARDAEQEFVDFLLKENEWRKLFNGR